MTESVSRTQERRPKRSGGLRLALWGVGGAIAGFVLATAMILLVAVVGMAAVIGFGYDQSIGAPIYVALFIFGIVGYALIVRFAIRRLGRKNPVPWIVWPALAAFPLAWTALSLSSTWKGLISPSVSLLAGLGLVLAWLSIRVDPRPQTAVVAEEPYGSPSETIVESNDPER